MGALRAALHAMPTWLTLLGVAALLLASAHDEFMDASDRAQRPDLVQAIDTAFSWVALAALFILVVAYFWPTD